MYCFHVRAYHASTAKRSSELMSLSGKNCFRQSVFDSTSKAAYSGTAPGSKLQDPLMMTIVQLASDNMLGPDRPGSRRDMCTNLGSTCRNFKHVNSSDKDQFRSIIHSNKVSAVLTSSTHHSPQEVMPNIKPNAIGIRDLLVVICKTRSDQFPTRVLAPPF